MKTPATPDRDAAARERRDELALTAGRAAGSAGELGAVRRVEDHRVPEAAHHVEGAQVADEIVVAEARAALRHHHLVIAAGGGLGDHVLHLPRREELPLLDVDRLAGGHDGADEIGLPAEKRRRLQHVHHRGHSRRLRGLVHVGEHRNADLTSHLGENGETVVEARAAEAIARRSVGFVERRLEDESHAQAARQVAQALGVTQRRVATLDDAGTGDQGERP